MLVAQRHQKIIELVNERGSIRVSEISDVCAVTEETIRRDLDKLEKEGKLVRSHGGASKIIDKPEPHYTEKEITNEEEKKKIAEEAIKYIDPKDILILDASTIAWYMASLIADMPLTVITNSVKVTLELSSKEQIYVISTGGKLSPGSLSFVGHIAEQSLQQYHVSKAFISCKGLHIERGISESNELQARVKQKMLSITDQVYLLADYSKFDTQAFASFASWEHIDHLITDSRTPITYINQLKTKSIKVIQLKD